VFDQLIGSDAKDIVRSAGHAKARIATFLTRLVERLFGLEYESVDWVFWHTVSLQHLDQLPTFLSIVLKNSFYLVIEINIRSKLDALNSILPFSHFRPPLLSTSQRMALFRPPNSTSACFLTPILTDLNCGGDPGPPNLLKSSRAVVPLALSLVPPRRRDSKRGPSGLRPISAIEFQRRFEIGLHREMCLPQP